MSEPTDRPSSSGPRAGAARRAVRIAPEQLVSFSALDPAHSLPTVATPQLAGLSLPQWLAAHRDQCAAQLRVSGALLFRGFQAPTIEQFEELLRDFSGELLHYTYGSTPRALVSGKVYTSTEYPPELRIPLHNEMCYARQWPMKLALMCVVAAEQGGETPIADSRRIYARMPAALRARFAERGVMYVRNYGAGLDVSWQDTFRTDDRAEVEAFCRGAGIEWQWLGEDGLRTRQVCQGVARHPETGEMVWFNQAHLFHVSNLDAGTRRLLTDNVGVEHLPRNALYGDGSAIADEDLDAVRRVLDAEAVCFPWQRGDVLLLDNMLAAHGREAFRGARRVVVGMNQSFALDAG